TLVLVDRSPSMWGQRMSARSDMPWADAAAIFGAAVALRAEVGPGWDVDLLPLVNEGDSNPRGWIFLLHRRLPTHTRRCATGLTWPPQASHPASPAVGPPGLVIAWQAIVKIAPAPYRARPIAVTAIGRSLP